VIAHADSPRVPAHPIDPLFHERWSPRAFTEEQIPEEELRILFEAARWAPSSMNAQPWRFVYARRGTPAFPRLLSVLAPRNQEWAKGAAALVAVVSQELVTVPGKDAPVPSATHSFDAGAAWAFLALQAHLRGWATHGMGGFDRERAMKELEVPARYRIEAFVAIGRRGDPATLPEWARAREVPSARKPVAELISEGAFRF
jgi:nitroreductase